MKGQGFAKALNMLPDVPHLVWPVWIWRVDVQDYMLHSTKSGNMAFDFEAPLSEIIETSPTGCEVVRKGLLALSYKINAFEMKGPVDAKQARLRRCIEAHLVYQTP